MSEIIPTIGIECHVQLKTKTKLFSAVSNEARQAAPNTLISHICTGMPGALPVLNEQAVQLAIKAGIALNAQINNFSKFERKHYFYPDLPKGYQISQYEQPIISGGYIEIVKDSNIRKIGITRAHLEEDAGKSTHPDGADYSLVDLNRAGTPLLEIVSQPEIHDAATAKIFAKELYLLMKYANVSDCDLFYGNMRFDVNISVSKDPNKLGIRSEIKNLNSFRAVENAVSFEINRQTELLKNGQSVIQETRGWDEAKQKTFSQRSKEEAHDYRYMPDPDIPPIVLADEQIEQIRNNEMPIMPMQIRAKLSGMDLDDSVIETLIDETSTGQFMAKISKDVNPSSVKKIANWLTSDVQALITSGKISIENIKLDEQQLVSLAKMVNDQLINSSAAKIILEKLIMSGGIAQQIAETEGLLQLSNSSEIDKIVADVLTENAKAAEDVSNGEMKAIGFLVGQVMKKSSGKANPAMAQEKIKKQLGVQ